MKFCLYFLTTIRKGETYPHTPGSVEAHKWLWTTNQVTLELTHNYDTENQEDFSYHVGNKEKDGFGHVAFNTPDVYAACKDLEEAGVSFKKKPDEGRMKGLAFAYDPDGYWVEIVSRRCAPGTISNYFNFSQTMLRVKNAEKSIAFYEAMGMKTVLQKKFDDFSLYFMASSVDDSIDFSKLSDEEAMSLLGSRFGPVLELTHNHGTEDDEDFKHYSGNEEGRQGFGHIGFLVNDVYEACDGIRKMGYGFKKEPDGGSMKGLAFAYDPDGYAIEIIKRGGLAFAYDPDGYAIEIIKR